MKLKPDCIRAVLLALEEADFNTEMRLYELCKILPSYSEDDIEYTCLKLYEGGFISAVSVQLLEPSPRIVSITDITYNGHMFLENIRSESTWNKTKNIAMEIGSFSVEALNNIASNIITSLISQHI